MNMKKTYYTAVGHFLRKADGSGRSYPVILVNGKEYMADIQEMALRTALSWRLLWRDRRSGREAQIMRLVRQALMSVGELVKCVEVGAKDVSTDEKLMWALYKVLPEQSPICIYGNRLFSSGSCVTRHFLTNTV